MKGQNNVDTTKTINLMEWCAGYCGIGLGLKSVLGERLRTIAYCELEGFAQANIISKMEKGLLDVAPLWSDLKTFPCQEFHGLVDILVAGYPCQPFSSAGKRQGENDPRHLWPYIRNAIGTMEPGMCFLENVEGHISLGLSTVISDLEELGYKVSWGIFSASEVGAPHQRKRVFILAYRICDGHDWRELQDRVEGWPSGQLPQPHTGESCGVWSETGGCGQVWPSRPGEPQHAWEPPRIVVDAKSQRAGQRSELRSEERGSRSALSWDVEQSGEGAMANANELRLEEHGLQHSGVSVGSGRGQDAEAMGNAASKRPHRGAQDRLGLQSEVFGERHEAMGNADPRGLASGIDAGSGTEADRGGQGDFEQTESGQIERSMGLHSHGTSDGLGHSELSILSHQELAEIREWMVKCDNRTDELRLLGNGVVPATAARAFVTLLQELTK